MIWVENFVMKGLKSTVITGAMEHCEYKGYGALRLQVSWSTVMNVIMDHCDDKCPGTL